MVDATNSPQTPPQPQPELLARAEAEQAAVARETQEAREREERARRDGAQTDEAAARRQREQLQMVGQFLNAIFSFLQEMLFGTDLQNAPDFEDAQNGAEYDRARDEYEGGRGARERASSTEFGRNFRPESIRANAEQLASMRARYGEGVEAIMPVEVNARISSQYGMRLHPKLGVQKMHDGIDVAPVPAGSKPPVLSAMPGIVVATGVRGGYGNTVDVIDIYGVRHRYAHLDSISVRVGQELEQGEQLGIMGTTGRSTGVHLHYEQIGAGNTRRDPILAGRSWRNGERFNGRALSEAAEVVRPSGAAPEGPAKSAPAAAKAATRPAAPKNEQSDEDLPAAAARMAREAGDNIAKAADEARENASKAFNNARAAIGGFFNR